jgi:hypothetical protein
MRQLGSTSQQFVKGSDDFIALFLQRPDSFPEILPGNENDLERVQDDRLAFDSGSRIEAGIGHFT